MNAPHFSNTTTSTTLLKGLLNPDNHALWSEFDRRYRPIVMGVARRLGLRAEDAADVAQDSLAQFFQAYRAGKYDRQQGRLRSWIMTIVRFRAIDHLRARAARGGECNQQVPDLPAEDGLAEFWDTERRKELLRQAIEDLRESSRLSEKSIRSFELYVLDERSAESVAAELVMTTQDVYMAKKRVAARLRELLLRLEELFDDG